MTAQFQDQEITFMDGSGSDESFPTSNVYSPNRQLLNGLLERRLISANRYLNRLNWLISLLWLTWRDRGSNRVFGDRRKTFEGTAN